MVVHTLNLENTCCMLYYCLYTAENIHPEKAEDPRVHISV